jgi:hypothetical protein
LGGWASGLNTGKNALTLWGNKFTVVANGPWAVLGSWSGEVDGLKLKD